jgi:hypothetical protein
MTVRLSALSAGRPLPPGRFLVFIPVMRLSPPQGQSAAERIRSVEKFSDLIGNRIRDLSACTIVFQPTTLPDIIKQRSYLQHVINISK